MDRFAKTLASILLVGVASAALTEEPVAVLIYETETSLAAPAQILKNQANELEGIEASVFGLGQAFDGYGSKYASVYKSLKSMSPERLVILSDGRDVLINNPADSSTYTESAANELRAVYNSLTAEFPGAVVVSAEAQCCVSALTHVEPGAYFNHQDGSREQRSCSSGEEGCMWNGEDMAKPWESFMKSLAVDRTQDENVEDAYLNAGLMAGTAGDFIRLIEDVAIGKDEDDQAVLTDFMYMHPDRIVLDYRQQMFGNNRGGLGSMEDGACMFGQAPDEERLVHYRTLTSPLFIHSPGGFMECHDALSEKLGVEQVSREARALFWKDKERGCNYRRICLGDGKLFGMDFNLKNKVFNFLGV